MRKFLLLIFTAGVGLFAETLPEWIVPLREAVYMQELGSNDIKPLYSFAVSASQNHLTGVSLDIALSRCEYLMGRALHYEKLNSEALVHYKEGMRLAEKAIEKEPGDESWLLLAESLSQSCAIGPWTYTMANGLNVEKFAKNALTINARNAAALYIVAARWVFAPAPFNNLKKGIEMMKEIPANSDPAKDDLFNIYSAVGYGYLQQKKYDEARPWLIKSLEIYPTNKFVAELLEKK